MSICKEDNARCCSCCDLLKALPLSANTDKVTADLPPMWQLVSSRVPFETSLDSKQPKRELKIVLVLSETICLFRLLLLHQNREVLIEPKHTEDQPKQFDREHILVFFQKI
jgi:hypothetical protein